MKGVKGELKAKVWSWLPAVSLPRAVRSGVQQYHFMPFSPIYPLYSSSQPGVISNIFQEELILDITHISTFNFHSANSLPTRGRIGKNVDIEIIVTVDTESNSA